MKKIVFLFAPIFFVISCSKENTATKPLPKLKFTVNAKAYEFEGDFDGTRVGEGSVVAILHNENEAFRYGEGYVLYGYDTRGKKVEHLIFGIAKDTSLPNNVLATKDYRYPIYVGYASSTAEIQFVYFDSSNTAYGLERYFGIATGDYISVNITTINNGNYNGTISGTVSTYPDTTQKANISGTFENLRVAE